MRHKKINITNGIILLLVIVSFYLGFTNYNDEFGQLLFHGDKLPATDSITIEPHFCQTENCTQILIENIQQSNNISCAFYDIDLDEIKRLLQEKHALVVIDNDHEDEFRGYNISLKSDWNSKLMHNKFCIFDNNKVITGSMNPTIRGAYKNDNNLIIITSKIFAQNYQTEFNEMYFHNDYHNKNGIQVPEPIIIDKEHDIALENYFCPEDSCQNNIISLLKEANESIYFMQFSFTSNAIGDIIVGKSHSIKVKGILEKTQNVNSIYSEYERFLDENISVILDSNPFNMHHKVFIIDKKIVIIGSMNPSNNGNYYNDENIVVIYDPFTAQQFLDEFERIEKESKENLNETRT